MLLRDLHFEFLIFFCFIWESLALDIHSFDQSDFLKDYWWMFQIDCFLISKSKRKVFYWLVYGQSLHNWAFHLFCFSPLMCSSICWNLHWFHPLLFFIQYPRVFLYLHDYLLLLLVSKETNESILSLFFHLQILENFSIQILCLFRFSCFSY